MNVILTLASSILLCQPAGAASYLWNVPTPAASDWNVNANWTPSTGNPGAADTATFGPTGTSTDSLTVNNVVSGNTTVSVLNFTNIAAAAWHVTQIPSNVTLSVTNLNVGYTAANGGNAGGATTTVAMYDAGTLSVVGNLTAGNGSTASSGGDGTATLDLSGLSNFVYSASSGTFQLGTVNRTAADMKFAAVSNYITAGTMNLNTTSSSSTKKGTVTLGSGTNIINAGTITASFQRNHCTIQFPAGSGTGAGLRIRGVTGADDSRATFSLANRTTSGSGGTSTGALLLDGHPVDIKLGTLTLGQGGATGSGTGNISVGTINFDTGTIEATNINMAVVTSLANCSATATITVGVGGTLIVGSGGLSLANVIAGASPTTIPSGTLTVNYGAVICSNSITKANTGGTGAISVTGGSLRMVSGVIGSQAVPIDSLSMGDSTLTLAVSANTTNVSVTQLTMASSTNNTINITALPTIVSYPAQFSLIRYVSGSSDCVLGSLPPGYVAHISNDTFGAVDLVVTSGPITVRPLVWNGTPTGDWNTSTANWLYLGSPTAYAQGDVVTFDDTLSPSGTTTVNLTTSLAPGSLTVSNITRNYTFNGTGTITGAVALVKDGAGQLTLANSGVNAFSGGVSILGGTLLLSGSSDRLPTNAVVTLADVSGAKLDLNNLSQTVQSLYGGGYNGGNLALGSGRLTDVGGGSYGGVISGSGQLIKTNFVTGGTLTLTNANTYSGGTIVGGYTNNTTLAVANQTGSGTGTGFVRVLTNGTFVFGNGGPGGSVAAGVITNNGTVRINRNDDFTFTNIVVGPGVLQIQNTNVVTITGTNGYSGGTSINPGNLRISNPGALGTGPVTIANSAPGVLQLTNSITFSNPLIIASKPSASGMVPNVENISGNNTLAGPISLTQNGAVGWVFYATADRLLISGTMTPLTGSQTSQTTTRNLLLGGGAVGEWSSAIIDPVGGTTNLSLRKDGLGTWILSGANTYTAPTVVSNGPLLVNGSLSASSVVTVAGGTLGGTGLIKGSVTVNAEGTLAPGASIGTLTIDNSLTLNGTTVMEVSDMGADQVAGIGSLTLGGTLQVVVNGTLTGWEVFKLFSATNYSGDFSFYDLPALPSPLSWDYSSVPVDGTLKVVGGLPQPTIAPVTASGTNLVVSIPTVSGTNYVLQSATNLTPTIYWLNESTNVGTGGTLTLNVPIQPNKPRKFLRFWVY